MDSNKLAAPAEPQRTYEDFDPLCKWQGHEKVEVHVPGFGLEHLSVQNNKHTGTVTIHGERLLTDLKESDGKTQRWSRFHKEIKVAETCDLNEVRAKLGGVVLTVTMPDRRPKTSTTPKDIDVATVAVTLVPRSKVDVALLVIKLVVAVSVVVVAAFGFGAYLVKTYKHGQQSPTTLLSTCLESMCVQISKLD